MTRAAWERFHTRARPAQVCTWERFHLGSRDPGPSDIVSDHQGQARGRHGDDACQDEGVTVRKNSKKWVAVAGIASISLLASACGGNDPETPATNSSGGSTSGETKDITLTVATFNNFGYTDELLKEYMDANPGIKVVHTKAAESKDARANLTTRIAAGGDGLADIEAIEIDWMPELSQVEDAFADLTDPAVDGRWLEWKLNQGKTPSGKLIGYGTDIGPEAVCYRADLFEEAGLPTDREEVAKLLEGDWAHYFEVGKTFVEKSDSARSRPPTRTRPPAMPRTSRPTPRSRRCTTRSSPSLPTCRRTSSSGRATGTPRSRRTASRRCCAPRG